MKGEAEAALIGLSIFCLLIFFSFDIFSFDIVFTFDVFFGYYALH
jgi:hypothetical protein